MRSRDYDMMPRLWRAMPPPSSDYKSHGPEYIDSSYTALARSPVVIKLIAQIIAAQVIKRNWCRWDGRWIAR